MAYTTYLNNAIVGHVVGKTAYTMPATWVALFTASPTTAGGGTETVYTNYARVATSGDWGAVASGAVSNSAALTFPTCGATGASIVAWALMDASSGGNVLMYGSVTYSAANGNAPQFAAGQLTVSQT